MQPVTLPSAILSYVAPKYPGATAWLLSRALRRARADSPFERMFLARLCCVTAVGTAAVEVFVQALLLTATTGMVLVKRCIYFSLMTSSFVLGGLFGLIYGNSFRFDAGFLAKKFLISVVLFSRHPIVLFDHFKIWAGASLEHALAAAQLTSTAYKIDYQLNRYFSADHMTYHAMKIYQLTRYVVAGLPFGLWNPKYLAKQACRSGLGIPTPPSIFRRMWRAIPSPYPLIGSGIAKICVVAGQHWDKIALLLAFSLAYKHWETITRLAQSDSRTLIGATLTQIADTTTTTYQTLKGMVTNDAGAADESVAELTERMKDLTNLVDKLLQAQQAHYNRQCAPIHGPYSSFVQRG